VKPHTAAAAAAAAAIALITAAGCGGHEASRSTTAGHPSPAAFAGERVLPGSPAADFSLRDQHGRLVSLSAQRGKLVLLTFLYTRCRDVCPAIADHLEQAVESLGPDRRRVQVLAVSVDPEHDTPRAVRTFVREHRLGPEFAYLTGTRAQLQPVWQAYNVLAMERNSRTIDHSAPTLLIDARGRPRVYYVSTFRAASVRHDLRKLLRG
jgi:protein SCO1/2